MKSTNSTYQLIRKAISLALLFSFLIPAGLQAKQFAEFCMPDRHGDMTMMADHSCCEPLPEETAADNHQEHDCDEATLCTCNISNQVPGEEEYLQPVKKQLLLPSVTELQTPFFSTDQPVQAEIHLAPAGNDIPLWLMFDTFLM